PPDALGRLGVRARLDHPSGRDDRGGRAGMVPEVPLVVHEPRPALCALHRATLTCDMLDELTAVECLRRLTVGELSAVELAELTLARIEAASDLNAVAALDGDATLAAAAEADAARAAGSTGLLLGLPVTIKDTIGVAGLPFRSGSLAREGNVAHE